MREARITCICNQIDLPDLGLTMTRGQVEYVAEARARPSADLQRGVRFGGLSVVYVERAATCRPAGLEPARIARPTVLAPEPPPAPPPTREELVTQVAQEVERRMRPLLAGYIGQPAGTVQEKAPKGRKKAPQQE